MLELTWLSALPGSSLEGGLKLLDRLQWNLSVTRSGPLCVVRAGHKILLKTDSDEVANAFVYGLALAHAVLPEHIYAALQKEMDEATGAST